MAKPRNKFNNKNEDSQDNIVKLAKRKFTDKDLLPFSPKTETQNKFVRAYHENIPLIIAHGHAGSGKSFCAINLALNEVLSTGGRDKIVLVRSAVQSREIGFTTGDIQQKEEPYEQVYRSIIADSMKYNDPYDNMKALGYIEFHSTTFIRGKTFNDAVIIVDEFQNMDYDELHSVITRAGKNTRIILCGDIRQSDLERNRGKQKTGVNRLLQVAKQLPYDMACELQFKADDIVRSGFVKAWIIADMDTPLE